MRSSFRPSGGGGSSYTHGPFIGAIRWDAWFGPSEVAEANDAGEAVETSLGPTAWRYRLPFFGTEVNATTITARGNTQATVDQEIVYARQAGLHYWAFVAYQPPDHPTLDHLTYGLKLYRASTAKQGLKYCLILGQLGAIADWSATAAQWVTMMREPDYMTVLGDRPLIYLLSSVSFSNGALAASHITTLRNLVTATGRGSPYIAATGSVAAAETMVNDLGLDAISGYSWAASNGGTGLENRTYASLAANNLSLRESALATGKKVIPCINEGWDKRPRYDNPPPWELGLQPNIWYTRATAAEFSNSVRDAIDWVRLNRAACDANTIIVYAWNEIDEGGWMTPPNGSFGTEGTTRLDGLKTALLNRRIVA